jgi:membrane AbrB-like protein
MQWGQQKYVALALAISLFCGGVGQFLGIPLPWMLGPMIGNTIAAMLGAPIKGPDQLRPFVIPIIGVMLGSSVTMALFAQLGDWVLTLILLPLFLAVAAGVSFLVYLRVGKYDAITAFYAAMPGGLNEMLMMGGEAGGDEKRIALAHAARVLIVIFFVVLFFWLVLGVTSNGSTGWIALKDLSAVDYIILGSCAVIGIWVGQQLKLPAAPIFGPMLMSAIAHVTGWVSVAPPTLFIILAQLVIGTVIGARFVGVSPQEITKDLFLAIISALGMLVITVTFAIVIVWQTGMNLSQAFLAYSPGGLTEMSLLSLAMEQDVTYVSLMHLIRITIVIAIAPIIFSRFLKRNS